MTVLTGRFSPTRPLSCAVGRHGELLVAQGNGIRPLRWLGTGAATDAGMDAPTEQPAIAVAQDKAYYIARVDVYKGGVEYYDAPSVTFSDDVLPPTARKAVASAFLAGSSVREIRVSESGKGYTGTPTVTLSETHGSGAEFAAVLDIPDTGPADPNNNPLTGITQWDITQEPADTESRFAGIDTLVCDLPITGNGTFSFPYTALFLKTNASGQYGGCTAPGWATSLSYTVTGLTPGAGTGAVLRLVWQGGIWLTTVGGTVNCVYWAGANRIASATAKKYGANYPKDSVVSVRINAVLGDTNQSFVISGYPTGNANNTTSRRYAVKAINVTQGGSGYVVAPLLKITSNSGFGASASCEISNGTITSVTVENGGGGYQSPPDVEAVAGGAEAVAVARPHLRGVYQCYYRYVDATPEDRGGPVPSDLSPVNEVDCGDGASSLTWGFPAPTGRRSKVELWRSTANEATALYRVTANATSSYLDDLTDDELRDANRADYAAMPVVMPNGELNANRFGVPPSQMAVVVAFQDRMWWGVDTSGTSPNTLRFSEIDEPESVPEVNELVVQQNAQTADAVQALIPFGSVLLVMQGRHAYALTYVRKPLLDAQVALMAYRGCLNQRCWDIYDGVCYVMDQFGVYAITPQGQVDGLSDSIKDYFRTRADFSQSQWYMVRFDPTLNVLRCFLSCKGDNGMGFATRCLTYDVLTKAWWEERFPQRLSGSAQVKLANGDFRSVYGGYGGVYLLGEGRADAARGAILSVKVTDRGAGYRTAPSVEAAGGSGAILEASLDGEGGVEAIWIKNPGFGFTSGQVAISAPNDPDCPAPRQAVAEFVASPMIRDLTIATNYVYKSGNVEYPSDSQNPKAASQASRHITLLYSPQPDTCTLSLRTFYNNASHPRRNVVHRDRGTGFVHSEVEPAARLDMSEYARKYGETTGVARSLLAGRTADDVQGNDRHVAVEFDGVRRQQPAVIIYSADVYGSTEG